MGDIISGIFTTIATYHYFQPAGTNEIIITGTFGTNNVRCGLYNGVTQSWSYATDNAGQQGTGMNIKIGITNTNYLLLYSDVTVPPSYTGIQIK
jgi:hypothetical protein